MGATSRTERCNTKMFLSFREVREASDIPARTEGARVVALCRFG